MPGPLYTKSMLETVFRIRRIPFFGPLGSESVIICTDLKDPNPALDPDPECGWDLAECGWDLAEWLERLTANAVVATVLGSIPASFDTVESVGRHEAALNIVHKKKKKTFNYIWCLENAVALKQKRDLPNLVISKEFLLSSSASRKRKSATATAVTSAVTNSAKSASSASVKSPSGLGAKRGRPAAGKKNSTPLVEKKGRQLQQKLLVESSFENRWELVRVGHRYLTIPRQPSLSIKTYSKRSRLKPQRQEKPVLLPGPDAAPINHSTSTSALGT